MLMQREMMEVAMLPTSVVETCKVPVRASSLSFYGPDVLATTCQLLNCAACLVAVRSTCSCRGHRVCRATNKWKMFCVCISTVDIGPTSKSEAEAASKCSLMGIAMGGKQNLAEEQHKVTKHITEG